MKLKAKWMGVVLAGAALSGCGALLGLDEFTEGSATTGTSMGTGGATTSSTSSGTGGSECIGAETQSCYDFDAALVGKGICKGGTKTCKDGAFGACEGQVGPNAEDCSKPEDENCDGVACSEAIWSKEFGDLAISEDLAVAPDGSIVVSGIFGNTVNFGPTPTTALVLATKAAFFLVKLAPDGSHLWSKAVVQTGDSNFLSRVAVAPNGQIFLSGAYEGTIDIDGQMLSASANNQLSFFVASFDKDGKRLWAKSFGSTSKAFMNDMAVSPEGDLVIVGEYANGTIAFDGAMYSSAMGKNAFVAKLAQSDGTVAWSNSYGADMSDQSLVAVSVASGGRIAVAGTTNALIDFNIGMGDLPLGGGVDVFVAQLGPAGDHVWHSFFRGPNDETVSSVAADSSGSIYLAGAFSGTTVFDAQDIPTSKSTTSATDTDFFLVKMNSNGSHGWVKQFGDSKPQIPIGPIFLCRRFRA